MAKNIIKLTIFLLVSSFSIQSKAQVIDPSTPYFQQNVNYKIDVELDNINQVLHGFIEIEYQNNSAVKIDSIAFHLWPNAYKNESTALAEQLVLNGNDDFYWSEEQKKGSIDSLDFRISGKEKINWKFDLRYIDLAYLKLATPLNSGDKIIITTPFRVKLPSTEWSRLGVSDEKQPNYMISQWFPKPAVFDQEGWHAMPYLNQGEFYSEFGNFEVNITVPKTLKVAASGKLAATKNTVLKYGKDIGNEGFTYTYNLENAHDFAWFASVNYEMKTKTIKLPSGKEIVLQAYFLSQNTETWRQALKYMERGLLFYSENIGEYPYDVCTAVDGNLAAGGGMEYPTITVIGQTDNLFELEITIVHEIGHNWFYGILGFNERNYPWMDEGLNTFYQSLYEDKYFANISLLEFYQGKENLQLKKLNLSLKDQYYYSYLFAVRKNLSQPLSYSSEEFSNLNYGISAYYKSVLLFRYLHSYLGDDEMKQLMHGFFDQWKFKHPQPEDFTDYFKAYASKNVNWFFDDLLLNNYKIDYAITHLKKLNDSLEITIKNMGNITVPITISSIDSSGNPLESKTLIGIKNKEKINFGKIGARKISIDYKKEMPDINRNNNTARCDKLFPTISPKKIKIGYSKPFIETDPLYLLPALGWNTTNGFMAGILMYNDPVFERKWEYQIAPLYSFSNKTMNGSLAFNRNYYTKGIIRKMSIGISARKYDYQSIEVEIKNTTHNNYLYFHRIVPKIDFFLSRTSNDSRIQKQLTIRMVNTYREYLDYTSNLGLQIPPSVATQKNTIYEATYLHKHNRKINPYGFEAKIQANQEFFKGQLTVNYRFDYTQKKGLDIRFFAGKMVSKNNVTTDYSFKMAGWDGSDDYLYDYTFANRNGNIGDGIWTAQMLINDGGFTIPTPLGRSWNWLAAVNLTSHVPGINFLRLYANAGIYPNPLYSGKPKLLYEAGVKISFINQYFEIYLPALWSKEIGEVAELNNRPFYDQKIRFMMRIDMANPFKWLKEMEL